jgi:uncharacterized glyoxalase superfamily protein PhnB
MHAMIRIGGDAIMLVDEMPQWGALGPKALKGSPVTIHLYVRRRRCVRQARGRGRGENHDAVADQFWGDRYGKLEDPFGHHWSVGTHVRDVSPTRCRSDEGDGEKGASRESTCASVYGEEGAMQAMDD